MRFILGFGVLLVLLIGGLLVAPSFINWDKYKDQGLAQVKARTGYDIAIDGSFAIGFLPSPHVKVSGVRVVNPAVSADPIATFDELSVGVAIAPLFQKQVQVSNVSLNKPVFDLRVDRNGRGNWLSPEVEALMPKKDGDEKPAGAGSSNSQNIAFDKISIKDGAFRFFDAAKGKDTVIKDINLDVAARSLEGPFDVKGNLEFGGQAVALDIETQKLDKVAGAIALRANVQYGAYGVALNGVVGTVAPFDVQGETQIKLAASALPISEDVVIAGILSANQQSAAIKDAVVKVGASEFKGQALVDMKPMSIKAAFEGSDVIDLAKFLPKSGGAKKTTDPLLMLTEIVPKSITLPQDFEADVSLKTGGLLHNQILLKNTTIKASKKDKAFKVSLRADDIPGTGPASVEADVNFASASTSKNGARVYSDPTLNFIVQANTQNTGNLVKALTGKTNIPIASMARIGKFYIKGDAKPGRFALKDSVVNLDDFKVLMSGNVKQGDTMPVIDFKVSSSVDDPYAFAKSLNVKTESWPKNLGAVRIGADLKGSMDDLAADAKVNAFGADFTVSGKLDELMSGKALDNLKVRVAHPNLATLLANVGASAPDFAAVSKPIDLNAVVKMDGKIVSLSNISAKILGTTMAGSLRYDGGAAKPDASGALKFGSLELKSNKGAKKSSGGSSSSSSAASSDGKWSSAPMDSGWLHAANANFDISADRLVYETWDISKPSLKITMRDGALDIKDLKGGLFDGQIAMQSKVSSASPTAPMAVSTNADIANVNIGKLAEALSGSKKLQGDGTVSLEMNVAGSGASQKALMSSLNGSAKLDGENVVLKGFDLEAITNAIENDNRASILAAVQSFSSGSTRFDTVAGAYTIQNGVVNIDSMAFNGKGASVTSTGNASLPLWTMDTKHTVTFNETDKLDPFSFSIRGPLDKPVSTFANIGRDLLQGQAGKLVQDLVGDEVGNVLQQFGIIPKQQKAAPANDNAETAPAAGGDAQPEPAQKTPEQEAQEAIENVIRGLF